MGEGRKGGGSVHLPGIYVESGHPTKINIERQLCGSFKSRSWSRAFIQINEMPRAFTRLCSLQLVAFARTLKERPHATFHKADFCACPTHFYFATRGNKWSEKVRLWEAEISQNTQARKSTNIKQCHKSDRSGKDGCGKDQTIIGSKNPVYVRLGVWRMDELSFPYLC